MVLVGPSGCGKSTLLRILTGLLPPTEGHVLYRGQPMHGVSPHVTLVFQTFVLFPRMTVQQNVEIALKAKGVPPAERTARATELLDRVGLDGFESASPRELSGGMRQRGRPSRKQVFICSSRRERRALTWDMVHTAPELEFAPEEADRQLATLVTWGRYAELLTSDDQTGVIAFNPATSPELQDSC